MTAPQLNVVENSDSIKSEQVEFSKQEIFDWLATLPEEFIVCRLVNHAWSLPHGYHDATVNTNGNPQEKRKVKQMNLVCDRCEAEKLLRIQVSRRKITRDISAPPILYPEGYLAPYGMTVNKALVLEFVSRRAGEAGGLKTK